MNREPAKAFEHASETLRFAAVLRLIARRCVSESSRRRIEALRPRTEPEAIAASLAEIEEYGRFYAENGDVPLTDTGYVKDVELASGRGVVLEPEQFLNVAAAEKTALETRRMLDKDPDDFPSLSGYASGITPHAELIKKVETAVDSDGRIKDSASPALRKIRRDAQRVRGALRGQSELHPFAHRSL